jgi:hypothetical protein
VGKMRGVKILWTGKRRRSLPVAGGAQDDKLFVLGGMGRPDGGIKPSLQESRDRRVPDCCRQGAPTEQEVEKSRSDRVRITPASVAARETNGEGKIRVAPVGMTD